MSEIKIPSRSSIFKKSVLAGILIAIGALFSIRAVTYGPVVQGLCFSVGLFGVLCTGAMLFTGSMLAMETVWRKETTISDVAVMWATIWTLNLVGVVCVALMAFDMGFDATTVAQAKAALPWHELMVRAVLCNVLVCFAVWTFNHGERTSVSALAACVLPVACFVACGFEHSVADMLYMPLGWLQGAVSLADCMRVILLATAGNMVGGIGFAWMVRK
jgi:formate/nitrite transporter